MEARGEAAAERERDREKGELRGKAKELRRSLSAEERERIDSLIRARLLELPAYRGADVVFSYLSFGSEVDTRRIIESAWADGKVVALPRCTGPRRMRWFRVDDFEDLEPSSFGMQEPRIDPAAEIDPVGTESSLALVPGLSFDPDGYRLGYGGGFYDAFLAGFTGASAGLCRHGSLSVDPLPRGQYDKPVDVVVTEANSAT